MKGFWVILPKSPECKLDLGQLIKVGAGWAHHSPFGKSLISCRDSDKSFIIINNVPVRICGFFLPDAIGMVSLEEAAIFAAIHLKEMTQNVRAVLYDGISGETYL